MSEIDGPKISVTPISYNSIGKQTSDAEPADTKESVQQLKDFSNAKAEAIGRSMLFKGNDNINNDLKALMEHPQIADNSDKMFELAYAEAQRTGMKNAYEEAASASTTPC